MCKTEAFLSSANPGLQKEGQEPRAKGTACERSLHREELKSSLYREELKKVSNTRVFLSSAPVSWLHLEPTNLCCANGRCRLNVIEVCRPETVIMLNIQNEDCFISEKSQKGSDLSDRLHQ